MSSPQTTPWVPPSKTNLPGIYDHFELGTHLGTGGYGSVYEARSEEYPGQILAIKFLLESGQFESDFGMQVNHGGIVKTYRWLPLDSFPSWKSAIVLDYCDSSLDKIIDRLKEAGNHLPQDVVVRYLANLAGGIEHLHSLNIFHRDIKPNNILIKFAKRDFFTGHPSMLRESTALLADLGVAVKIDPSLNDQTSAQNTFERRERYSKEDIWKFGKVIEFLLPYIYDCPQWLKQLCNSCLHPNLTTRSGIQSIHKQLLLKIYDSTDDAPPSMVPMSFTPQTSSNSDISTPFGVTTLSPPTTNFAFTPALWREFCTWLRSRHQELELRGVRGAGGTPRIMLDTVYVALKGDIANDAERESSRQLLDEECIDIITQQYGEVAPEQFLQELNDIRWKMFANQPLMTSLLERDRASSQLASQVRVVNLAEAFCQERKLVILGDPGSGKTTLVKWLALHLSQAILSSQHRVLVPRKQVDPDTLDASYVDLGPTRLPILLRVSDYAEAYAKNPIELIDYLGYHPWLGEMPTYNGSPLKPEELNAVIRSALRDNRVVILLDGMDEITTSDNRSDIVKAIERFIEIWVDQKPLELHGKGVVLEFIAPPPVESGGNQIVITSRIAGYHATPIKGGLTHVTIEPMQQTSVGLFVDQWMAAVHKAIARPNESEEVILKRASEEALALKDAIFDPSQPRIKELACNPLLTTIIAIVFRKSRSLPTHRAELYHHALEILIEDWRDTGLTVAETIEILAPVAAHIHAKYATGLIQERELREKLREQMIGLSRYKSLDSSDFDKALNQFLGVIHRDVGLLAARGEKIYGFLHLTFQEYLAGLALIRDRQIAPTLFANSLGNPRQKEPLVLALGRIGTSWGPEESRIFLEQLLDAEDPMGDLIPRLPLLLARGLDEMATVHKNVVKKLSQRLILAYVDRQGVAQIENVRQEIEKALHRLHDSPHSNELESVFLELIENPPSNIPDATAGVVSLLRQFRWYTENLIRAIQSAQARDRKEWNWPIQEALREIAFPGPLPKEPTPPKRPSEEDIAYLKANEPNTYQTLTKNLAVEESTYLTRVRRHHGEVRLRHFKLATDQLLFRNALEQNPAWVEFIKGDPGWLRLVVAIYGGYENVGAVETFRDYRDIAAWLQQEDSVREAMIASNREFYIGRFGSEDTVYNAAVYLDTGLDGRMSRAKSEPVFNPTTIFRDSFLTNYLIRAIRNQQTSQSLKEYLHTVWSRVTRSDQAADVLLGLLALGEPISSLLNGCKEERRLAIVHRLQQLEAYLADPITRLLQLESVKEPLRKPSTSQPWLAERHEELYRIACGMSIDFADGLFPTKAESDTPAYQLTEYWLSSFRAFPQDDQVYNYAVALDRLGAFDPEKALQSLTTLFAAENARSPHLQLDWELEALPPRFSFDENAPEIPLEIIDAVCSVRSEQIRASFRFALVECLLKSVTPLFPQLRNQTIELLILNMVNPEKEKIAAKLDPTFSIHASLPKQWEELTTRAGLIADPYFRARAWLALAKILPVVQKDTLIPNIIGTLKAINDPHRRCRVTEYLTPFVNNLQDRDRLTREGIEVAKQISDPDHRTRALIRWSRRVTGSAQRELLALAVEAVATIPPQKYKEQAETSRLIRPYFVAEPDLLESLDCVVSLIPEEWYRAHALKLRGQQLLQAESALATTTPEQPTAWSLIVLGLLVQDANRTEGATESIESLWQHLQEYPSEGVQALLNRGRENGLQLTRQAAEAIDSLLEIGAEDLVLPLFPLLQNAALDAISIVDNWLKHWNPSVQDCAALIIAEPNRLLTPDTINGLINLLRHKDDRLRLRAELIFTGGIDKIKRESRFFKISQLEPVVRDTIADTAVRFYQSEPYVSRVLYLMLGDLLCDDPLWITELFEHILTNSARARQSEWILKRLWDVTEDIWLCYEHAYQQLPEEKQAIIIQSFMSLFVVDNKLSSNPKSLQWIFTNSKSDGLRKPRIISNERCSVVEATKAALLRRPNESFESQLEAIRQEMAVRDLTLGSLHNPDDSAIISVLKQMGDSLCYFSKANSSFRLLASETDCSDVSEELLDHNLFSVLVRWLNAELEESIQDTGDYILRSWLLFTCSLGVERLPDLFAKLSRDLKLETKIAEVVRTSRSMTSRVFATYLLGRQSRLSENSVRALQHALVDGNHVRYAAMRVFESLPRLDVNSITPLIQGLYDPSTAVAHSSAQVLSHLGRSERTDPVLRQQILSELAKAVRSLKVDRGIYTFVGAGEDGEGRYQLKCIGSLRQAFFRCLIDLSGV